MKFYKCTHHTALQFLQFDKGPLLYLVKGHYDFNHTYTLDLLNQRDRVFLYGKNNACG